MAQNPEDRPLRGEVQRRIKALELTLDYFRALGSNMQDVYNREPRSDEHNAPLGTPSSIPRIADTFLHYLSGESDSDNPHEE